ncbi:DsbA family oxidoreductase [Marilutibacter alkalisoli]|uniref:DsbA family oxidoreductase n=1 Tax=Marilutibacter alkalisoli TaxID=2591633 RepID=A0A514BNK5_9GAMM|nr:DsbA family oxidoreductase [Lysobacter alkalisoli]QDH68978.1 DsbA family oxidoreductase [Lysobacter alkalisoli]
MSEPVSVRIDFVSDVACPWCAVGLNALERAIERVGDEVVVELHFQPFELNPQMPPEGEDADEHLAAKYGLTPEQLEKNRETLRERGEAVGFSFGRRTRIHNTFDAHRLLHWAGEQGPEAQRALKHALLRAYQGEGRDVSSHDVLAEVAGEAGLDLEAARAVLASDAHADDVRSQEQFYAGRGIRAVPSVIFDDQHLIQGGQPVEVFEQALRQLARFAHTA